MALLKDHAYLGKVGPGEQVFERRRYDFSKDGGATGALTIFTLNDALVVTNFHTTVKTACTSGGSATLIVGHNGDTDSFCTLTQGAVASLTLAATILPVAIEGTPNALNMPIALAAGATIVQTIGTAALTAGVVEYCIGYVNA